MKLNCGPSRAEKRAAKREKEADWHSFFTIWPRRIDGDCYWLHRVERKIYHGPRAVYYRLPTNKQHEGEV